MKRILLELARVILGSVFVLSGFLKAIDPKGSALKIAEYINSMLGADWAWLTDVSVVLSIFLCVLEFALGAFLLMGIYRRMVSRLSFALMVVMTLVTVYIYVTGTMSDCGCFGEAFKISNGTSLAKNVVLLLLAYFVMMYPRSMGHLFSRRERWLPALLAIGGITYFTYQNYYSLPYLDFRPYRIGYNLRERIQQEDSTYQQALLRGTKYVYRRGEQEQTFTASSLPDSSWTYVRLEQDPELKNYKPTYYLELRDEYGEMREQEILQDTVGTILLLSPNWIHADQRSIHQIDELYRYVRDRGYGFYGVSASTPEEEAEWRYQTGAAYPILFADATTIKTIARANPALVFLRDGVIKDKISATMLPKLEELPQFVESRMQGIESSLPSPGRIVPIVLWGLTLVLALLRVLVRRLNIVGYRTSRE